MMTCVKILGTSAAFRGLKGRDALALCDNANEANMSECEWREVDYTKVRTVAL